MVETLCFNQSWLDEVKLFAFRPRYLDPNCLDVSSPLLYFDLGRTAHREYQMFRWGDLLSIYRKDDVPWQDTRGSSRSAGVNNLKDPTPAVFRLFLKVGGTQSCAA